VHQFAGDSEGNLYTAEVFGGRAQKFVPRPGADPAHFFKAVPLVPKTATATGGTGPAPLQSIFTGHGSANFSGSWKLAQADPPVPAGRGGRGAGGGGIFGAAPATLTITQSGNQISLQIGAEQENFTLDDKITEATPGDISGLRTHAHWDGEKLHLHFNRGINFGRDVLSLDGGTLTVVRDLESGGGSTTRTLTYTKAS
jgi:hypothetical protein